MESAARLGAVLHWTKLRATQTRPTTQTVLICSLLMRKSAAYLFTCESLLGFIITGPFAMDMKASGTCFVEVMGRLSEA